MGELTHPKFPERQSPPLTHFLEIVKMSRIIYHHSYNYYRESIDYRGADADSDVDDDKRLPLRPCLQSTCSLQRIRIDTPRRRRPTFCVINFSFAAQLCDTDKPPFDSLPCILSLQINPFVSLEAFLWGWSALYAFKCCT